MSEFLMAAWDGAGATPPLMSVARSLVARGAPRARAGGPRAAPGRGGGRRHPCPLDPRSPPDDPVSGDAVHPGLGDGFPAMRDNLAVGPAAAFAADMREELERRPAASPRPCCSALSSPPRPPACRPSS